MPHFMIVLKLYINLLYQFIKPFLDNKMSIFEEYGTFMSVKLHYVIKSVYCVLP